MTNLSQNSKFSVTLGAIIAVAGSLLYAGWFASGLLRDIKDEVVAARAEVKAAAADRWTGRDMRDYAAESKDLNNQVQRTDGKSGLYVPDVRRIQRMNQGDN